MIPIDSPAAGVAIALDPARGTWRIEAEAPRTLRPWRWAERRALVAACARDGRLDGPRFAAAICATLYDPPPPDALVPLHALIALDLLGVGDDPPPRSLGAQEARLAARFGWLPGAFGEEAAPALDRLLAGLDDVAAAPAARAGWHSIRIQDDG